MIVRGIQMCWLIGADQPLGDARLAVARLAVEEQAAAGVDRLADLAERARARASGRKTRCTGRAASGLSLRIDCCSTLAM